MQEDKFQTDDELKPNVMNWVHNQDKTFMLLAPVTCQGTVKKICSYK
jgi:hypothetical protein